jgi:hypothetical protein
MSKLGLGTERDTGHEGHADEDHKRHEEHAK